MVYTHVWVRPCIETTAVAPVLVDIVQDASWQPSQSKWEFPYPGPEATQSEHLLNQSPPPSHLPPCAPPMDIPIDLYCKRSAFDTIETANGCTMVLHIPLSLDVYRDKLMPTCGAMATSSINDCKCTGLAIFIAISPKSTILRDTWRNSISFPRTVLLLSVKADAGCSV